MYLVGWLCLLTLDKCCFLKYVYKPKLFIIRFNRQNDISVNNNKHSIGEKKKKITKITGLMTHYS